MSYKSSSRNGTAITLLAGHTTESAWTVARLAEFFSQPDAQGSAHAGIDADSVLAMVPDYRAAWTLRSGNPKSLNAEMCAFAGMTRDQWLSETDIVFVGKATGGKPMTVRRPRQILRNFSAWLAEKSQAYDVPLVKLSPTQVAQGHSGVIGHIDWTEGMHDGSHTDPETVRGTFPWDVVLDDARALLAHDPADEPEKEADPMILTYVLPAYAPPPEEDQDPDREYVNMIAPALPETRYGWDAYLHTGGHNGVANVARWHWIEQHPDGVVTTPPIDQYANARGGVLGKGTFDLQPGQRHRWPGHPAVTGIELALWRNPEPVVLTLVERTSPAVSS